MALAAVRSAATGRGNAATAGRGWGGRGHVKACLEAEWCTAGVGIAQHAGAAHVIRVADDRRYGALRVAAERRREAVVRMGHIQRRVDAVVPGNGRQSVNELMN